MWLSKSSDVGNWKIFGSWGLKIVPSQGNLENRRISRIENRRIIRDIFTQSIGNLKRKTGGGRSVEKKIFVGYPRENKWIFGCHRLDFCLGVRLEHINSQENLLKKNFFVGSHPPKIRMWVLKILYGPRSNWHLQKSWDLRFGLFGGAGPKNLECARNLSGWGRLSQWRGPVSPVPRPLYLSGFRPTISAPMPTLSQCLGQLSQLQRHLSQCQNQKAKNISEKDPGPASLRPSLQPAWRNFSMLSQNFVAETV